MGDHDPRPTSRGLLKAGPLREGQTITTSLARTGWSSAAHSRRSRRRQMGVALVYRHQEDHTPARGYEPTRDAAMAQWRRSL
jgi:hypothetical protein